MLSFLSGHPFIKQPSIQKVTQGFIGKWNDFYNNEYLASILDWKILDGDITISSYATSKSMWIEKYMTIITGYPEAVLYRIDQNYLHQT